MVGVQPRISIDEITRHPSFPTVIWKLIPTRKGRLPVAAGRRGPINIDWEIHGTGSIKFVWIMGLGSIKTSWQRQTLKFGHNEGHKYSVLIFDNRGMGKSDKPLMRYSTSEMAKDVIELLDHVGWDADRQIHVSGVSMGGMIAQELAFLIPERICSLNLFSTAAKVENTTTFLENMQTRIRMFLPKTLENSIHESSETLFSEKWLSSPDDTNVPTASSPNVEMPESGEYGMFSTNMERFAAQEICKRLDTEQYGSKGFFLQLIAAAWHHKSPEQLKKIGDQVGRERIMVVHGAEDRMITAPHGKKLISYLEPSVGIVVEGVGHVFMVENSKYHIELIETMVNKCEAMKESPERI